MDRTNPQVPVSILGDKSFESVPLPMVIATLTFSVNGMGEFAALLTKGIRTCVVKPLYIELVAMEDMTD